MLNHRNPFASLRLCVNPTTPTPIRKGANMYSLSYLSRQIEALRSRLKPVLAILKLRKLAMEFCGEFDEADSPDQPNRSQVLGDMAAMFPPRVGQAGFRLDTFQDVVDYLTRCIKRKTSPRNRLHPHPLGQERPHPPPRPLGAPRRRLNRNPLPLRGRVRACPALDAGVGVKSLTSNAVSNRASPILFIP